jgi:RNA polymerase sigma-70 factor (TIGR02943 family)
LETHHLSDPSEWVDLHGDSLFRYALLRTRDPRVAEDLVQETFLAALQDRAQFAGRSSERTWLIGILKHKILDYFRQTSRESTLDSDDQKTTEVVADLFDDQGYWQSPATAPKNWTEDPSQILERKEFWDVLAHCMAALSPRQAQAFSLREIDDLDSEEICKLLNISATNLWVMLHRARSHLRRCLEIHYMGLKA